MADTMAKHIPKLDKVHINGGATATTLLNAHGNPIKHYGDLDLDMSRLKLDQAGAISRFIA